ncbi:MAG: ATP-dependent Clp protease proteolytic subunit [Pseudomonadota bacterium]
MSTFSIAAMLNRFQIVGTVAVALILAGCVTVQERQSTNAAAVTATVSPTVEAAESAVNETQSDDSDQNGRLNEIKSYLDDGAVGAAYEIYLTDTDRYADNYNVLRRLANALRGQKRYLDAIDVYESALEAAGNDVEKGDIENYVGLALHDIGRYAESVEWIDRAIENHPSDVFRSNRAVIAKKLKDLKSKDDRPSDLVVYYISRVNLDTVARLIQKVSQYVEDGAENIYLFILSGGGDANAGIAAFNFLESLDVNIHTINLSLVGSAATYFYCAGDKRYAYPYSRFLFHGTKISNRELLSKDEYEVNILTHEILEDTVAELYTRCSDQSESTIRDVYLSREGRIASANESQILGFVHSVKSSYPEIEGADVFTIHKLNKNFP